MQDQRDDNRYVRHLRHVRIHDHVDWHFNRDIDRNIHEHRYVNRNLDWDDHRYVDEHDDWYDYRDLDRNDDRYIDDDNDSVLDWDEHRNIDWHEHVDHDGRNHQYIDHHWWRHDHDPREGIDGPRVQLSRVALRDHRHA